MKCNHLFQFIIFFKISFQLWKLFISMHWPLRTFWFMLCLHFITRNNKLLPSSCKSRIQLIMKILGIYKNKQEKKTDNWLCGCLDYHINSLTFRTIWNVAVLKSDCTINGVAPGHLIVIRISTIVFMFRGRQSHESHREIM